MKPLRIRMLSALWAVPAICVVMTATTDQARGTEDLPALPYSGTWRPYDDIAHRDLGTLTIANGRLVFGKGLEWRTVMAPFGFVIDPTDGAKPMMHGGTLCGDLPVRAVSVMVEPATKGKTIRVSVHDVASGPGSDPDFDLHRCQTFTYVRD